MSELLETWEQLLQPLEFDTDGFLRGGDARFGIGAVLLVQQSTSSEVLMVKKAEKLGYEFSGLWALPGGMVRRIAQPASPVPLADAASSVLTSLTTRAAKEADLYLNRQEVRALKAIDMDPPPVASYTVAGERKHTIVLPFIIRMSREFSPAPGDASVTDAAWKHPVRSLSGLAPANRLIVASYLKDELGQGEREEIRPLIQEAAQSCSAWATEAGLPPVAI